jgi:hypothetical protein
MTGSCLHYRLGLHRRCLARPRPSTQLHPTLRGTYCVRRRWRKSWERLLPLASHRVRTWPCVICGRTWHLGDTGPLLEKKTYMTNKEMKKEINTYTDLSRCLRKVWKHACTQHHDNTFSRDISIDYSSWSLHAIR